MPGKNEYAAEGKHTNQIVFFFFQAEDGIRDYKVTGVQTCALPISARIISAALRLAGRTLNLSRPCRTPPASRASPRTSSVLPTMLPVIDALTSVEIGRASCRERV